MIKFYSASYDASIYLQLPKQNTGIDGILEVGKFYTGTTKEIYRTLIKFPTSDISSSISSNEISGSWKGFLNLKSAFSTELPIDYTLYSYPVSQSWTMGIGKKYDYITTQGVSWQYRDGVNEWSSSGASWYTASAASQSFSYSTDDVRMDITDIIKLWLSGSIVNDGLIIKHSSSVENDSLNYGYVKFFSKETDTIYEPKLEIVWDDAVFNTGSLSPVTGTAEDGYKVVLTNLKTKYPKDAKIQIRIKGRDKYPLKSFGSTFQYDQSKYLPTTTYYQLEDYVTGEIIYPFGEYTKVSCDTNGNYFNINLATLPIGRTYELKIKIIENGVSTIISQKSIFEIEY
jgi:hypothetical protein